MVGGRGRIVDGRSAIVFGGTLAVRYRCGDGVHVIDVGQQVASGPRQREDDQAERQAENSTMEDSVLVHDSAKDPPVQDTRQVEDAAYRAWFPDGKPGKDFDDEPYSAGENGRSTSHPSVLP